MLPELDLDIPAGQTVALVGATGAGKTTLAKLIVPLLRPDRRARCCSTASTCASCAEPDLRQAVVMVTQEGFLFSGTVADNIAFGRPGRHRRAR